MREACPQTTSEYDVAVLLFGCCCLFQFHLNFTKYMSKNRLQCQKFHILCCNWRLRQKFVFMPIDSPKYGMLNETQIASLDQSTIVSYFQGHSEPLILLCFLQFHWFQIKNVITIANDILILCILSLNVYTDVVILCVPFMNIFILDYTLYRHHRRKDYIACASKINSL